MNNTELCLSQAEETFNSTFDRRLRSLELRQAEADTLLHVHTALLSELQTQLRNLSATVQDMSHNVGCVVRTAPLLGMRDTLPPGTHKPPKLPPFHALESVF